MNIFMQDTMYVSILFNNSNFHKLVVSKIFICFSMCYVFFTRAGWWVKWICALGPHDVINTHSQRRNSLSLSLTIFLSPPPPSLSLSLSLSLSFFLSLSVFFSLSLSLSLSVFSLSLPLSSPFLSSPSLYLFLSMSPSVSLSPLCIPLFQNHMHTHSDKHTQPHTHTKKPHTQTLTTRNHNSVMHNSPDLPLLTT